MVVDTMVFVYALLKVEGKYEEALAVIEKADSVIVPDSFRAELTNTFWQWVKFGNAPEEATFKALQRAEGLIDRVVSTKEVWVSALQIAIALEHPVYDTLFVATAMMHDEKVVTYDKKLQSKFANWTISPETFLSL